MELKKQMKRGNPKQLENGSACIGSSLNRDSDRYDVMIKLGDHTLYVPVGEVLFLMNDLDAAVNQTIEMNNERIADIKNRNGQ